MAHKFQKDAVPLDHPQVFLQLCPVFLTFCWGVRGLPDCPSFHEGRRVEPGDLQEKHGSLRRSLAHAAASVGGISAARTAPSRHLEHKRCMVTCKLCTKGEKWGGIDRKTNVMLPGGHVFMSFHMCSCDLRTVYVWFCCGFHMTSTPRAPPESRGFVQHVRGRYPAVPQNANLHGEDDRWW